MFKKIKEYIVNTFCTKYSIPYFLLMVLWSRWLHIKKKNNKYHGDKFMNKLKENINSLRENNRYFICLKGAAWDYSYYYIFLKKILELCYIKNIRDIIILWNKKYEDILQLFKKDFPFLDFCLTEDYLFLETESEAEIRKKYKLWSKWYFLDFRDMYDENISLFNIDSNYSHYEYCLGLSRKISDISKIWNKFVLNNGTYDYDKLDTKKLDSIINNYANRENLIICNFENKSYKLARKDSIKFKDYLDKIKWIALNNSIKFVVNSVYDDENLYNDENILITRLNFQEIIWLAENKKVKLFISERNWLNDVFKVFYPEINQIIYYPNYYNPICDKKVYYSLYKEILENLDVKDFWHLPWNNIIEDIRWNYFDTIEKYIYSFGLFF